MRAWLRRHPEWWMIAMSAAAWAMLLASRVPPHHAAADVRMALSDWLLMTAAMMLPLAVTPVRGTAARSLWSRRHWAIAAFVIGYGLAWCTAGAFFIVAVGAAARLIELHVLSIVMLLVAAAWHVGPARRRAVLACDRSMPLAPSGWRANWDCVSFGMFFGRQCVLRCWAAMLAASLIHSAAGMILISLIGFVEERPPSGATTGAFAFVALATVV
jgi:hypothetical protein